ncbi:hypothetical protein NNJEOMEG_01714 [Fundidesulfovibrio magnetotacticus]|uniref:GIY-YIG domain-containing protein n=1 Tax=Fundidesulfovibrio magnetotacticus TaxID=2730080 RepID=A0A6V8LVN8_9BACT|nr:hypothetical protein NNJEOMEG_01714 [Fundidesulfovibrio magnetotacticus]
MPAEGRIVINLEQRINRRTDERLYVSTVTNQRDEKEISPVVFIVMQSVTLNIPMRVEIPWRALIKGGRDLRGTYSVYAHFLFSSDNKYYAYYGITKRGWNTRFSEHVKCGISDESKRLFPKTMNSLIQAKLSEMNNIPVNVPKLEGVVTSICAVGLNTDQAMDTEEYLVDKYSLSSKHEYGLNMIPGGYEGIRCLHRLAILKEPMHIDTEERELLLEKHLKEHPQLGIPNPGVAAKWNDPQYAEAVICGNENRLKAEQVRQIRYLAAIGNEIDVICAKVEIHDFERVKRVVKGRTYSRIQ